MGRDATPRPSHPAYLAASPPFPCRLATPNGQAFDCLSLTLPVQIGQAFDCLSLTLEMPFKDSADLPEPIQVGVGEEEESADLLVGSCFKEEALP